jgi:hypothetical protein
MAEITFKLGKYNIPLRWKKIYEQVQKGKSYKWAIKAKCLDCCCWQEGEVKKCPAVDCPLYLHRPFSKRPKNTNRKGNSNLKGRPGSIPMSYDMH